MTKEQENAIKNLESFIDHFQILIKQAGKANDEAFDREKAEQDITDFKIAIQSIIELDKMNGIALDLAAENDELIEKLDAIRAEIEQTVSRYSISRECGFVGQVEWSDRLIKESEVLQIIDKYREESRNADNN